MRKAAKPQPSLPIIEGEEPVSNETDHVSMEASTINSSTTKHANGASTHKTQVPKTPSKQKKKYIPKIPEWLSVLPEYPVENGAGSTKVKGVDPVTSVQEENRLVIQLPSEGFTQTSLDNLLLLIASKSNLIKTAISADELPVYRSGAILCFPWFTGNISGEEVAAYAQFICALCDMAKRQKRVIATEKQVDNEKYAFRCFLLRLGLIGDEYAITRKVLMRNMVGNGSWKNGETKRHQAINTKKETKPAQPLKVKSAPKKPKGVTKPAKRGLSLMGWLTSRITH